MHAGAGRELMWEDMDEDGVVWKGIEWYGVEGDVRDMCLYLLWIRSCGVICIQGMDVMCILLVVFGKYGKGWDQLVARFVSPIIKRVVLPKMYAVDPVV